MNISISKSARNLVYSLKLDSGLSPQQVLECYANEEWEVETFARPLNLNRVTGYRQIIMHSTRGMLDKRLLKTARLIQLYEYILSPAVKNSIISMLYEDDEFSRLWGLNQSLLSNITKLTANYVIDLPGQHVKLHLDNRLLVGTGMIYLNEKTEGNQSTRFYSDEKRSNPFIIEPGFQNGWFAANVQTNWHEGFNKANTNRLSILLGLGIDVPLLLQHKALQ